MFTMVKRGSRPEQLAAAPGLPIVSSGHGDGSSSSTRNMDASSQSNGVERLKSVQASPLSKRIHPYQISRSIGSEKNLRQPRETKKASNKVISIAEDQTVVYPTIRLSDVRGQCKAIENLQRLLVHFDNQDFLKKWGVSGNNGILLLGSPGSGKTFVAHAIAGELNRPMVKLIAPEVVSGISGDSEGKLRDIFKKAKEYAPSILFIDEVDIIAQKRESADKDMGRRIVSQLLSCIDELNNGESEEKVLVIAATNNPDSLDPALRRSGRFDTEISLAIPDEASRLQILEIMMDPLRRCGKLGEVDLSITAHNTPGFVAADLKSLVTETVMNAFDRVFENISSCNEGVTESTQEAVMPSLSDIPMDVDRRIEDPSKFDHSHSLLNLSVLLRNGSELIGKHMEEMKILPQDLAAALKRVQPSAKREGFATIPDISWEDVGALTDIREELDSAILAPVEAPELFEKMNIRNPPGILLYGPPGCGKTLLAKAIANESGLNFISVKGPELLNMYVGESERAVRKVFHRARYSAPCVIFFDEVDALCPRRSEMGDNNASSRLVNQMLTEMDGLEARKLVFVIGATNRPDMLDPAILRPGRFDKLLFVDLPNAEARVSVLKTLTRKTPLEENLDLEELARVTEGFSGADLASLVREASTMVIQETWRESRQNRNSRADVLLKLDQVRVESRHFQQALHKIKPSVTPQAYQSYTELKEKLRRS